VSDSVQTTFEEASRCPQCKQPGKDTKSIPIPLGVWLVQVDPDGSVPPPQDHSKKPKLYLGFEGHDQRAMEIANQLRAGIERERLASEQAGGHEVRNRRENI
jgi:hypothetical protein